MARATCIFTLVASVMLLVSNVPLGSWICGTDGHVVVPLSTVDPNGRRSGKAGESDVGTVSPRRLVRSISSGYGNEGLLSSHDPDDQFEWRQQKHAPLKILHRHHQHREPPMMERRPDEESSPTEPTPTRLTFVPLPHEDKLGTNGYDYTNAAYDTVSEQPDAEGGPSVSNGEPSSIDEPIPSGGQDDIVASKPTGIVSLATTTALPVTLSSTVAATVPAKSQPETKHSRHQHQHQHHQNRRSSSVSKSM